MKKKPHRSQSRSIGLVGIVNICAAVVAILQAFAVGRFFGTTVGIENYFAAVLFYQSILKLTQTGQIAEVFTPYYHSLKASKGPRVAFDLLSVLLNWLLLFAAGLTAILYFSAGFIIPFVVPGFEPERLETCISMFRLIIPLLSLKVIEALLANLLVGEKQFVAPEIARLICAILGLALIVFFHATYYAWVMIGALWVSNITSLLLFACLLYRTGYRYSPRFSHHEFSILHIFKNIPAIFGYVSCTQIYSIAITAGLSALPQGTLAVYTYAQKISSRINGVLMTPLSVVFFNHFSSALASGGESVKKLTDQALKIAIVVSTFALVATLSGGFPGLKAIWLSDIFSETSVFHTYIVTIAFCALPFCNALGLIYRKINMSHQLISQQYLLTTLVQIVSTPLAIYTIPAIGLAGAIGLIFFNGLAMAIASGFILKTRVPNSFATYKLTDTLKCALVLLISATPVLLLQFHFDLVFTFSDTRLANLATCLSYSAAGILIAFLTAYAANLIQLNWKRQNTESAVSKYV